MKKIIFLVGFVVSILGSVYCLYCWFFGRLPFGPQPDEYGDTSGASTVSFVFAMACAVLIYLFYKGLPRKKEHQT